jgi:glycosyltransferase involved in cell wall biosynthesis
MATGLPLVVADAGALPELCQLGRNGIRFPTDDAQAMGEAISALLLDPDLARKYGIESLAIAGQHSLDATIKKYELLYDMLIAQRHATTPSGARV